MKVEGVTMAELLRFYNDFQPSHYDLYIDINRSKKTIVGKTTIVGEARKTDIAIHQKYLNVKSVKENGKNYKINAAYVKGGDEKTKSVVQNLLGITVNYIVKIDYAAFRGFIDAIGVVDMEIERDMKYDDDGQNLHIDFKGGTVAHLNGQKAEEFFRWRKNNDGTGFANGDLDRIENQHKFLQKVVDKCKKPSILFKLP